MKEFSLAQYSSDLLVAILARCRCPVPNCYGVHVPKIVKTNDDYIKVSESKFLCCSCMLGQTGQRLNKEAAEKYASKYGLKIKKG